MSAFSSSVQSLYVHVPFCAAKCEYCAFFSELSSGEQMNRFVDALIREMELVASSLKPRTIFFGGGTPSLLSLAQWRRILEAMEEAQKEGKGAVALDGRLIDIASIKQAEVMVQKSEQIKAAG